MKYQILLSSLVFAACSDASLTKTNALPTATITYPSDGEAFLEGYAYTLRGMVGDPDNNFADLRSNWLINGEPHCETVQPDSGGLSQCTVVFEPNDTEIALEVFDPAGASAVDYSNITVEATQAPVVSITSPLSTSTYYATQSTILSGSVSDAEDPAEQINVSWTSSVDGLLEGDFNTPDSSGTVIGGTVLSEGEHLLTLEAIDSTGKNARDVVAITVLGQNTDPTCSILFPSDGDSLPGNAPVALSGTVFDPETPFDSLSISWSSDIDGPLGTSTVNADGSTLLAIPQLSIGTHTVTLFAEDDANGTCQSQVSFAINTAPTQPTLSLSPVNPDTTIDITALASGSTDADGDTVSYLYAWDLNGGLTGETSDIFPSSLTTKGDTLILTVTPTDGLSDGTVAQDSTTIVNAPPTIQSHALSQSNAEVGDTVTCIANATDPDPIDTLAITYQWSTGTIGNTYTIQPTDAVGNVVTCNVSVDDGDGGIVQSSQAVTINNSDPQAAVSIAPTNPNGSDPLTCTVAATDANNHTLTHSFAWTLNGQPISHSVLSSLDSQVIGAFVAQDTLLCSVTTTDGFGGTASASASVTITNTPPTLTIPTVTPTTAYTNDVLTATTIASDIDGDSLTITYDWNVNGQVVQSGTLNTFDGSQSNAFDKNDMVSVSASVSDGQTSSSQSSTPITIQNTLPTAASISLIPSSPATGDPIECVMDSPSTDDDGDAISYTFDWTVEGNPYLNGTTTTYTNDTIPAGVTQSSELWECTLTPDDGDGNGPSSTATTETCDVILNFNGGYDYITLDPLTSMPNDKTMEAWVRLDAPPSGSVQLMSSRCGVVWISSTEISVGTINNCGGANSGCKSGYTNSTSWVNNNAPGNDGGFLYAGWDGSWKHIAITITSNELATLYIDGVWFDSAQLSADGCMSATTIGTIGRHNVYGNSLEGDIAEVRMSSSIEYSGGFTPQYPLPVTNNTEVLYGLQNDYGLSIVTDDSGNGINGTLNGTTWDLGGPACP